MDPKTVRTFAQVEATAAQGAIIHFSDCSSDEPYPFVPFFLHVQCLVPAAETIDVASWETAYYANSYATSIKRLTVRSQDNEEVLGLILVACGHQLVQLQTVIGSQRALEDIASFCTHLLDLKLNVSCRNLEWRPETAPHGILQHVLPQVGWNPSKT